MTTELTSTQRRYLETALWSTSGLTEDLSCKSLDDVITPDEMVAHFPNWTSQSLKELAEFLAAAYDQGLLTDDDDTEYAAHNFWLSREGHGAGFFDGDYDNRGDRLQKMADSYGTGELNVSVRLAGDGQVAGFWDERGEFHSI